MCFAGGPYRGPPAEPKRDFELTQERRIENGVSSIVPVGLVVNTVDQQEKARFEVGTGEYNKMIDKKVSEIKAQCKI